MMSLKDYVSNSERALNIHPELKAHFGGQPEPGNIFLEPRPRWSFISPE